MLEELPEHLAAHGVQRPLVVTDRGLATLDIFEHLQATLQHAGAGFGVFAAVEPNPEPRHVEAGVEAYRAEGCDGVVGFGGGSALDAAKAVALMVGHPGTVLDYGADHAGWDQVVPGDVPPLIAIPTTAGTGSEVGRSTVITCPVTEHKKVIFAPALLPKLALLDPVLTLSLPPHITAATGMDALSHCVESYLSPVFHPLCDSVALGGVRRIARALERAVLRGQEDLDARSEMLIAASMGAIAFQKELGATHALAHPLSTLCGVPHGTANGMLLARVMRYNLDVAEERLAEIAEALGVGRGMPAGSRAAAEAGCHFVEDLAARIGIPRTLSEVGVDPDMLDALAEKAFEDPCHQTNPRPCSRADLRALYAAAL